jgi:hypothetical protein
MTDDMGFDLKLPAVGELTLPQWQDWLVRYNAVLGERDARIEKLEAVTKDDAKWLAAYHKWCEMNGCAPSSSDLIAARKTLEGKDD